MKFLNAKTPLTLLFFSVLVFVLFDNLIFRSGFYAIYLSDDKGTTVPLKIKYVFDHESKENPNILISGDSLIRAGLRLRDFQKQNPNTPFTLLPLTVSATGSYTLYHLLKEIDPSRERYHTIILPVESYKILSNLDVTNDTKYMETRRILTFTKSKEWPALLEEYKGTEDYKKLLMICLFMNRAYRDDMETFIPTRRIAQNLRSENENYLRFYEGPVTTKIVSPLNTPPAPEAQRKQTLPKVLAYHKEYLTKFLELYKNSPTQIIFMQMPHAFYDADRSPLPDAPDLRDILPHNQNVHFLDEHYFDALNQCKYMKDNHHLNKEGSTIFTKMLTPLLYKFAGNDPLPRIIEK